MHTIINRQLIAVKKERKMDSISKTKLIDRKKHHILTAPHPSPLSSYRGFFGCKHFSQTNDILKSLNKEAIIW